MLQGKRILWVDNDKAFTKPFCMALEGKGCEIEVQKELGKASIRLRDDQFDLLILDAMIPTKNESEEQEYISDKIDEPTGLIFYKRVKPQLDACQTKVLVITVLLSEEIRKAFIEAGLPKFCFSTKFELRRMSEFISRINGVIDGMPL